MGTSSYHKRYMNKYIKQMHLDFRKGNIDGNPFQLIFLLCIGEEK